MIKLFRNKQTQKRIYIVLAVAVVITFLVSGILVSKDSHSSAALGKIDGKKISAQDYLASYKAVDHQAKLLFGDKYQQMHSMINFKGEAWDRLLLLDYAKKHNISATDDEVVRWIASQSVFSSQGHFDDRLYKLYLSQYLRIEAREFEEEARQFLTIVKINEKMQSNLSVSDQELRKWYDMENGERDIQYVTLPWKSEKNNIKVEEADLKQIFPLVKDRLTGPEHKTLSFEEAKEPLTAIILKQKARELAVKKLDDLKKKISGQDFEKALIAEGLEVRKFNQLKKDSSVPELGPTATFQRYLSELKEGETSEVFPVLSGAALVKVLKISGADAKQFETDKETFRKTVRGKKSQEEEGRMLEKLRDKLQINLELMKEIFPEEK